MWFQRVLRPWALALVLGTSLAAIAASPQHEPPRPEWQRDVSEEKPTKLHLTAGEHDATMRDGINFSVDRPVPAGVHRVRIVVRDNQSGVVDSLTIPVAP